MRLVIATLLLAWPMGVAAQAPAAPQAGGPPAGSAPRIGADAGPAQQQPRTDAPQSVHRGTDGSVAGLERSGTTGATPQGNEGDATAGARNPQAPVGGHPPQNRPAR